MERGCSHSNTSVLFQGPAIEDDTTVLGTGTSVGNDFRLLRIACHCPLQDKIPASFILKKKLMFLKCFLSVSLFKLSELVTTARRESREELTGCPRLSTLSWRMRRTIGSLFAELHSLRGCPPSLLVGEALSNCRRHLSRDLREENG